VLVHEDHKAPVVAVGVWYHVGSKDEPAGKTGFAHLFEHLMFNGSENHRASSSSRSSRPAPPTMNGTTWFDRTNYYETVPTTALDMALWMESDRMGHLLGAIDQKTLDEQRGVVQNEKRQGENQPYGRVDERMLLQTFPANHPYHHDTIGSMADLNAASLDDVKTWFRTYYGAANTTVVLSGDIDPATAKAKMLKYFGDIPAGPAVAHQVEWVAPRATSTATRWTTASPRRASTANGTCRRAASATWRCWTWPRTCWAAARPRACTSGWCTRTSWSTTFPSASPRSSWSASSCCRPTSNRESTRRRSSK
jgi:predicted Zn-dependent peptidase